VLDWLSTNIEPVQLQNGQLMLKHFRVFKYLISYVLSGMLLVSLLVVTIVTAGSYTQNIGSLSNFLSSDEQRNAIITAVTSEDETIWVAPLYPEIYIENKRMPANKNIFYLPWQSENLELNQELLDDLEVNKPNVIFFTREVDIWGYYLKDYGSGVKNYIDENYFVIEDEKYQNFYFRKSNKENIINNLYNEGLLSEGYQDSVVASNEKKDEVLGNIMNKSIKQEIGITANTMSRLSFNFGTYNHVNQGTVTLVVTDQDDKNILFTKKYELADVLDNSWHIFPFDKSIDVFGMQKIYVELIFESELTSDLITLYCSNDTSNLSIDGTLVNKTILYKVYTSEDVE